MPLLIGDFFNDFALSWEVASRYQLARFKFGSCQSCPQMILIIGPRHVHRHGDVAQGRYWIAISGHHLLFSVLGRLAEGGGALEGAFAFV